MLKKEKRRKHLLILAAGIVVVGIVLTVFFYPTQFADKVGPDCSNNLLGINCIYPNLGQYDTEKYQIAMDEMNEILKEMKIRRSLSINKIDLYESDKLRYKFHAYSPSANKMFYVKVGDESNDSIVVLDEIFCYKVVDDNEFKRKVEQAMTALFPVQK